MAEIKMEQIAKMYGEEHKAYWNGNKMAEVAQLFGKKLNERFPVNRDGMVFDCMFTKNGLDTFGVYENPYVNLDDFILTELLTGQIKIHDQKR